MEPIAQLEITLPTLGNLVEGVRTDQLDNPTPCRKWVVRDLLGHFAGGFTSCASAFRAGTPVDPSPRLDLLDGDPAAAVAVAIQELDAAMHASDALEKTLTLPFGEIPAPVFLRFLAFDLMVHSWDLATATGQEYSPSDELVAAADGFARQGVAPEMRDGDTFAAEVEAKPDANPLERLVAFSGRRT